MNLFLFNKNLEALNNKILKEKLENFKPQKFQILQGKDSLDINFIHHGKEYTLYSNTLSELNEKLNLYNDKYLLYPVLYFYGFGNGILYKALLQNKYRQKIVIFEKEIEFIYLSFQCIDFSEELKDRRLVILDIESIDINTYNNICSNSPFFNFLRVYFLDIHCDYYERYQEDIIKTNQNMQIHIKQAILAKGTDSQDALKGIENFIYNLPDIISNFSFKELMLKRKGGSKHAIVVSTGPSLIKQLPLLKKYADKATIFCADSAYPILAKHDIKPDYVLSVERIKETSEFFNNDFGEFDQDIIFILSSVTHLNTVKYLKQNHRKFIFIQRMLPLDKYFHLKQFEYSTGCPSVANMAYFLALKLEYKNIFLVGQDLAYGSDGSSHPEEYHYGKYDTYNPQEIHYNLKILAYGGKNLIPTTNTWIMFKTELEKKILYAKNFLNITTYNCTEGGARIEETIEKPFKEVCQKILEKEPKKYFTKLEKSNLNKQIELMLKSFYKVHKAIKICNILEKECTLTFNTLYFLSNDEKNFNNIINQLDIFKEKMHKVLILHSIADSLNAQFELNLARIYIFNPKTKEEAFNKNHLWIKEHLEWILTINSHIKVLKNTLKKNIINIENELKNMHLQKYILKIEKTRLHYQF
ncbi:motility associated factor glycosyltransferase family protein [Campylobacter sp. RKI_CA19_01116]|uniref:motility associated factor glycosyltransferase family protein n=1 Tax=Campylobacter sp. RKI_CA19_01116 TaxID=2911625 RepID=UPI0021E89CE4|nr:motility associated factor glycosyltransferase family protein [Campylobacter sp. RKI_CA19_01116]MCV3396224.1 motility associated factor glycosyltransferase family protein [Campylobacter sp. RKI_CA19_01116]